jgi:hypothetical protein
MIRPNPAHLTTQIPGNLGDPALDIWILLWGSHSLLTEPLRLLDANIFWPNAHTLAYSEMLLPLVPVFGLLHATTGSWALSLTTLSILLVLLNLLATYALARRITDRTDAAILGALAFGLSSYVLSKLGAVQLETVGLLPLAFLLLLRLLERPSMKRAVLLGAVSALVDLCASYYGAIYAVSAVVIVLGFLWARRRRVDPWLVPCLLVAAAVAALLVAPVAIEYLRLQEQSAFRRSLSGEFVLHFNSFLSPAPGNYLWHRAASSATDYESTGFFPGLAVTLLAAVGCLTLGWRLRRRGESKADDSGRRDLGLLVLAGLAALILALGPDIFGLPGPYRLLHGNVPGFAGIRAPARFGVVTLLSIVMLASYGYARVAERVRSPRLALLLPLAVGALILGERASPLPWVVLPNDGVTLAAYHALAQRLPGAVVELPVDPLDPFIGAPRMVYSTIDWHPRLNGYSGYFPATYVSDAEVVSGFPNQPSLDRLRERRIRYVILHVGQESGYAVITPAHAAAIIDALPPGATATHVGSSWLIDLATP